MMTRNGGRNRQRIDRAGGRQYRIQGAHQVQDFTEAVPRSGVILIGDFFTLGDEPGVFSGMSGCVFPAYRSHRAGNSFTSKAGNKATRTLIPFTSKPASCSHRRWATVHIDSNERND